MPGPAGLYIHVPFCSAICPYCDFAVLVGGEAMRRRYVETLLREMDLAADFPCAFDTIYFGGGTPSLLAASALELLLAKVRDRFDFEGEPRIFLEANPEDVDAGNLDVWRRIGVGTLSLGVQSFDRDDLAFLGRRHAPDRSVAAVEDALEGGFDTVSVDLIYGLPGQELAPWLRTLELAARLGPHHVSCYELEVHERTAFGKRKARGELEEPPEDIRADLFVETHRALNGAGYSGYEVSNFARAPEHRSRHNLKYWDHSPYLGLGLGAHSFDGARRFWNERSLARYERKVLSGCLPRAGEETLTLRRRAVEELMLGLRTCAGIDLERFGRSYGTSLMEPNRTRILRWRDEGLLELDADFVRPTVRGLAVADALAASLDVSSVPAEDPRAPDVRATKPETTV